MKAKCEAPCAVRSVRNFGQKQLVEFWVDGMSLNHRFDHGAHEFIERGSRMLYELSLDETVDLLYVALMQSDKNRPLVRKVLVDGADTHSRDLSDPIRRDRLETLTL